MIITVSQYNTVINGLRTQLELMRHQIQERTTERDLATTCCDEIRKQRDLQVKNCEHWMKMADSRRKALESLHLFLQGEGSTVDIPDEDVDLMARMLDLIRQLRDTKKAKKAKK